MKQLFILFGVFFISYSLFSQEYFPKNDGVKTTEDNYHAFTNATIHPTPQTTLKNASLVIQKGKIIAVGKSITIPKNAIITDLKGKHIYASFIDLYTNFGIEKPKGKVSNPWVGNLQFKPSRNGYYWNDHIRPETNALDHFKYNKNKATEYIKEGFGVLNTHMPDGIVRGTSMLVALKNQGNTAERLLSDRSSQVFSFKKSTKSKQVYPSSLMGAMALIRQLYLDADWYSKGNIDTKDLAIEAFNKNKNLPQLFYTDTSINSIRADKVGDDSGVQYTLVGSGKEYSRINEIKKTKAAYIIPLNFPEAMDVSDPTNQRLVSLEDMRYWNQAAINPSSLAKNDIKFSLTSNKLKKLSDFTKNLKKAIKAGLDKQTALASLTTIPAEILDKSDQLGSLKKGALANFLITEKALFDDENIIYENWTLGAKNVINDINVIDLKGKYSLKVSDKNYSLSISGKPSKPKVEITFNNTKLNSKATYKNNWINITIPDIDSTKTSYTRLRAYIDHNTNKWSGKAILPNGIESVFLATKNKDNTANTKNKEKTKIPTPKVMPVTYPNKAFGFKSLPESKTTLFKNATVWTNETSGILKKTDVLIKNGKIVEIRKNITAKGALIIDATGKHLTTGIIDEHSHIATTAVNEAGHNSSAEVSIEDVVDPDDINIYRNLAGGVTSIQILHGSANPIGGRSAIIKLKWGETSDNLIYNNSPKFIKFALGENVKQSNWGGRSRFPQSRMGVEQLYTDYFTRAKQYETKKKSGKPYRKDIEMETLLEILNGQRFISCHSYIQSEINMLMKLAEKFNFKVNTFTHILEGYKVADKMEKHGAGGSTFSDWWAYKYEVNDAIPYNAAIMHNQGVTVAINSDDPEMSRRLNQEAAKSVKYGGVSEEDAWKFITLNPAKLLHIDNRVGSIKVGKDADLVLWSDHPLSIYSKAEKTMIEGAFYFDLERDKALRKNLISEKNELIAMLIKAKNAGVKTQAPKKKDKQHFHCNTLHTIN